MSSLLGRTLFSGRNETERPNSFRTEQAGCVCLGDCRLTVILVNNITIHLELKVVGGDFDLFSCSAKTFPLDTSGNDVIGGGDRPTGSGCGGDGRACCSNSGSSSTARSLWCYSWRHSRWCWA